MSNWSPYRDTAEAGFDGTSVSIADVMAADGMQRPGQEFATGRYRAHMIGPYLQYFDCDLRTTGALHAEGVLVPGICIGQRFQGRWSSEIGDARIDMDEASDLIAYGSCANLDFLETQQADTSIRMSALYIGADFFEAMPFDAPQPAALQRLMGSKGLISRKLGKAPALRALFRQMYDNPCQSYLAQLRMGSLGLAAVAELAECLGDATGLNGARGRSRELAYAARDFLDQHLAALPAMADVAARCGSNESSMRRAFKAEFGLSLTEYARDRLLEEARRHLREGRLQVAEIAYRSGFSDPANFTTAYRRHFGHPPSADRPNNQGQIAKPPRN